MEIIVMVFETLRVSHGAVRLGDERGRTQQDNSNIYCQDCKISWLNRIEVYFSSLNSRSTFVVKILFSVDVDGFAAHRLPETNSKTSLACKFDGEHATEEDLQDDYAKSFAVFINGRGMCSRILISERATDDSFFNAYEGSIDTN